MCLEDLRINRRLSRRTITVTVPGADSVGPYDFSRASMVELINPDQGAFLVTSPGGGQDTRIGHSLEIGTEGDTTKFYTRSTVGASFGFPVWLFSAETLILTMVIHEYDTETMHEIYSPSIKG